MAVPEVLRNLVRPALETIELAQDFIPDGKPFDPAKPDEYVASLKIRKAS